MSKGTTPHNSGFVRGGKPKAFFYSDKRGKRLTAKKTLAWIKSLVIPPAWKDVWISDDQNARILVTGRDIKGRKQYRYNPAWRKKQDQSKYLRIIEFGKHLPDVRKQAYRDLKRKGLPREKVLAAVVLLLEKTRIRVGNEEYARTNKSYGLTTLQDRHVKIKGKKVVFAFVGKSGKSHEIELQDPALATIIHKCRELPGTDLFQYIDDEGKQHDVTSEEVNNYLRNIAGKDFSAKDFRTWSGTVLAALALQEFERVDSQARAKKNVTQAIESVSKELGNTPSICRACYIHPSVIECYMDGSLLEIFQEEAQKKLRRSVKGLTSEEAMVLAFLESRLEKEVTKQRRSAR